MISKFRSAFVGLSDFLFAVFVFGSLLTLVGCSSTEKDANTAEGAFAIAEEYDHADRYEEAIRRYSEVKSKYPYSRFATQSELAIADVYFKQESFAEAQVAYKTFESLHPKHARIDYVVFRSALSYFNQLPPTVDRDLSLAKDAIQGFDDLVDRFPSSSHVAESKEKKMKTVRMLAEKEKYIADFYYKTEVYDSALGRYMDLLNQYPGMGYEVDALKGAALSAFKSGDQDRSKRYYARLKAEFPTSDQVREVEREIRK